VLFLILIRLWWIKTLCDPQGFFIEWPHTKGYDDCVTKMRKQKSEISRTLQQTDEVKAAIDYGIDVSMLIDNIKRSPAERIRRHQIALNTAQKLRRAKHL